jgi:RNA polymerase sigma-70 factor, ECF subfamily
MTRAPVSPAGSHGHIQHPATQADPDDATLVDALGRGDKSALARLYDRHASLLLALGIRILGDRSRAEDLLHDVFLEAWHHAHDFDPARGSVRAWLVTRMRSRALDRRLAVARQQRLAEAAAGDAEANPGESGGDGAVTLDGERLRSHLRTMPPELIAVLELSYFEGLSSSEIGSRLGIPTGTVKSRMARALATLRESMGERGAEP